MRFGIALESFTPPGNHLEVSQLYQTAELAESLGFDSVWVWDHLLLGSRKVFPVLDCPTLLASIGARTKKIKLGSSVLVIALRQPVVLAKVLSTIQYLTDGRLLLGAATGWYEKEFKAAGVNFQKRGRIFEDRFSLLRRLLTEQDLSYSGEGIQLEHANMEPKPRQPLPMLIGGYSDSVLERAGRLGDGWIGYYYTPSSFEEAWSKVEGSAKRAGRDTSRMRRVNIVPLAIASDYDTADKQAREFTSKYMDLPKNTGCTVDSAIRGTVEQCREQLARYQKAGVTDLVFIPAFYHLETVEKAGKELLPSFMK